MSESQEAMEMKPVERSTSVGAGSGSPSRTGKGGNGKAQGGKSRKEYGYRNQKQPFQGPPAKNNQGSARATFKYGTVADKKPRSRRQMGRSADTWKDEFDMCGLTGSTSPKFNSKPPSSISLNHLLNFTLEPRQNDFVPFRSIRKSKYTPFNKEQFLQANCQFVVRETGDYTFHNVDSDMLVDWNLIEQVSIFSHDVPSCPICLFPPTAAKITRCGHIYCWSCVLHYLSLTDNNWQKCPICFEAVHATDLKSVVSMKTHRYTRGEKISLRLMQRVKGSVVAVPKSQWNDRQGKPYSVSDTDVDTCFIKLLVASTEDVLNKVIKKEKDILKQQLKAFKSEQSGEQCFVESALTMLETREKELLQSLKNEESINNMLQGMKVSEGKVDPQDSNGNDIVSTWRTLSPKAIERVDEYEAAFSDDEKEEEISDDTRESIDTSINTLPDDESSEPGDASPEPGDARSEAGDARSEIGDARSEVGDAWEDSLKTDSTQINPTNDAIETAAIQSENATEQSGDARNTGHFSVSYSNVPTAECDAASLASDDTSSTASGSDIGMFAGTSGPECYYFYQSDDGQNVFLHPVNARILIMEYGSLQNSPEFITGKIIEMEAFAQSEVVRKRYRYLSHLPLTCEFVVCELDLNPELLGKETLNGFRDILRQRKWQRQKKAKEERKREKKQSERNQQPAMRLSLSSERDFPQHFNMEYSSSSQDFPSPSADQQPSSTESSCNSSIASSPSASFINEIGGSSPDAMPSVPSFAQALRSGKVNAVESRAKTSVPWKTSDTVATSTKQGGSESDHEDYVPVPTFQTAFSAALLTADWGQSNSEVTQENGKKPKKAKKKLLFTTSVFPKYH